MGTRASCRTKWRVCPGRVRTSGVRRGAGRGRRPMRRGLRRKRAGMKPRSRYRFTHCDSRWRLRRFLLRGHGLRGGAVPLGRLRPGPRIGKRAVRLVPALGRVGCRWATSQCAGAQCAGSECDDSSGAEPIRCVALRRRRVASLALRRCERNVQAADSNR